MDEERITGAHLIQLCVIIDVPRMRHFERRRSVRAVRWLSVDRLTWYHREIRVIVVPA